MQGEAIGLLDLLPKSEEIDVGHGKWTVRALSARQIARLFERFPKFQAVFVQSEITPEDIIAKGPELAAAIIAASCGMLDDPAAEEVAANIGIEFQVAALHAIGRCTFTRGFGPFARQVQGIIGALSGVVGRPQASRSPNPSSPSAATETPASGT